ncbi:MAG: hypothetical protein HQL55_19295, partial [Magnetococcales bacterium]|nr:hypothetical protein [Magnetococcales bacterium]
LMQDSKALRNRSLFAQMDIGKVKKVELQRPDYAMSFAKGGEEKWRLQTPVADRAHPQRFSSWLEMLLMANATGFKAATPPAKPDWQIILNGGEAEGQKVVLWKDKEDILASRQGEPDAMVLPKYLAKDLDKSGLEMVDLRVLEGGSLSRLQATWQGKTIGVEKKENNWPLPAWNSVEESLTRDGVEAMMGVGEPASVELVLEAAAGDGKWQIKGWKEGKDMVLAVPDRPVRIRLSTLQTEALEKSLQVVFAPPEEKKADKGVVEQK